MQLPTTYKITVETEHLGFKYVYEFLAAGLDITQEIPFEDVRLLNSGHGFSHTFKNEYKLQARCVSGTLTKTEISNPTNVVKQEVQFNRRLEVL
jgi:hypothetical protein